MMTQFDLQVIGLFFHFCPDMNQSLLLNLVSGKGV